MDVKGQNMYMVSKQTQKVLDSKSDQTRYQSAGSINTKTFARSWRTWAKEISTSGQIEIYGQSLKQQQQQQQPQQQQQTQEQQ